MAEVYTIVSTIYAANRKRRGSGLGIMALGIDTLLNELPKKVDLISDLVCMCKGVMILQGVNV